MNECLNRVNYEKNDWSDDFSSISKNADSNLSLGKHRERLPINSYRRYFLYLVKNYQVVLITGETGCGKSTQIPQYLYDADWTASGRNILIAEPRRIAAISLAVRVSQERDCVLGNLVGYRVRFDQCYDKNITKIIYVTNGLLLKMLVSDPVLSDVKVIVIDEIHERSVEVDILISTIKRLMCSKRPDLKLILSSASSNKEKLMNFFTKGDINPSKFSGHINNTTDQVKYLKCYAINIPGREFKVKIYNIDCPVANYINKSFEIVKKIHIQQSRVDNGAILVFLSGQDEIEYLISLLNKESDSIKDICKMNIRILPLHGGLSRNQQQRVFQYCNRETRKIIVSTNIAETSLTITDVKYVIDSGFEKLRVYNVKSNIESLYIMPISKSSAIQRAGRAGRLTDGEVYRLYTKKAYDNFRDNVIPEIQRTNNEQVILKLKSLKIDKLLDVQFLSPLNRNVVLSSLEKLFAMNILDEAFAFIQPYAQLTLDLPLNASDAISLYNADKLNCMQEMLTLISMMQVKSIFIQPRNRRKAADDSRRRFCVKEGDHISLINVYNLYIVNKENQIWCQQNYLNYGALNRSVEIRTQLKSLLIKNYNVNTESTCEGNLELIFRCLVSGYFTSIACLDSENTYRTVKNYHKLSIHKQSCLFEEKLSECVLFTDIVVTAEGNDEMCQVSSIPYNIIISQMPHYFAGRAKTAGVSAHQTSTIEEDSEDSD
ncbi:G4-resolvase 1 [Intoshia linei]|uniref:RNA helicase n=1 Tax=Intoshia linei TaxID=1819745 RepID=A0A177ASG0_9BILA|nr:G4-resolvase 1 [Intoshia linei]